MRVPSTEFAIRAYLEATDRQLCLLLNFGMSRLKIKRVVNGL